ncbi:hypothetical protein BGX21_006967 [Mortierella sp. AD011]|nr:hypothetical protein BGX21_006967 [Mortierella sp. AD011]
MDLLTASSRHLLSTLNKLTDNSLTTSLPRSLPVKPCVFPPASASHIVLPDSLYFTIFFIFGGGLYILLLLPFTLRQKQLMAAPLVAGLFVAPLVFSATNSPALQFVHLSACACVLMRQIDLYYVRPWRTGKEPTFNLEDWWTETWQPFRKVPMSKGQLQRYELELQQERLQQESSSSSGKTKTSESNDSKPVKQLYTPRIDPNPKHWSAYLPRWLFYAMFMEIISFCMGFITYERTQTFSILSNLAFTTAVGAMVIFDISLINYTIMIIWAAATGNLIHDTEWTLVRHYFPGFATSPSEFWRQWHHLFQYIWVDLGFKPVYHVLHKHVTPKISNRKLAKDIEMVFPVMGVFLMSGLMHEYMIRGMWHARLGGMTSFFLIQGAGTIVSKIIYDTVGRKVAVPSVILIALTWVFNLTTASLFLDPVLNNFPVDKAQQHVQSKLDKVLDKSLRRVFHPDPAEVGLVLDYLRSMGWKAIESETEADIRIVQDCLPGDVAVSEESDLLIYQSAETV